MSRSGAAVVVLCVILSFAALTIAQSGRLCYQFTWLGPRYNNESVFMNATCQDATRLASGVPCREPLVASDDGSWPDVDYIWTHYRQHATCVPAANDICAKYTYYFDGVVENSTYLCTRALDSMGQAITSGCYEQRNGSFVTRACFCDTIDGAMPCNDAPLTSAISTALFFSAIAFTLRRI